MHLRLIVAGFIAVLCSTAAQAQVCCRDSDIKNWYFGGNAGLSELKDYDTTLHGFVGTPAHLVFNRPGYNLNADVGYRLSPYFRAELEGGYYDHSINKSKTSNVNFVTLQSGQIYQNQESVDLMANLYADWHNASYFTPYIGAGAGIMHVHTGLSQTLNSGEEEKFIGWEPAAQFMLGVAYELHENVSMPVEVTLGYRYVTAQDGEVKFKTAPGSSIEFQNTSQDVELGFRVYF